MRDLRTVIVSTDCDEIMQRADLAVVKMYGERVAEGYGVHRRGPELSKPGVSATKATIAAIDDASIEEEATVVQLLPTSPFRTEEHIEAALALYFERDPGYSAVLSVTPVHRKALCYESSSGWLAKAELFLPIGFRDGEWNQPHPVYVSNGAIQITSAKLLRQHGDFWKIPKKIAYLMDEFAGFDVDSQAQFDMAQAVIASESDGSL